MAAPTDVAGLVRRWRADSIGQANASAVASWPALTGGAALTQSTATAQPTYRTAVVNGQPVVRFDGTSDYLRATITAVPQPVTVVFVVSVTSGARYNQLMHSGAAQIFGDATGEWAMNAGGTTQHGGTPGPAWQVVTVVLNGADSEIHTNGTLVEDDSPGSSGLGTTFDVGAWSASGRWLSGDVAEIIVYDRALSVGERSTVHSYVQDRYAITVADYSAAVLTGAGALTATPATLAGTGTSDAIVGITGAGALTATPATLTGAGVHAQPITGAGAMTGPAATLAGMEVPRLVTATHRGWRYIVQRIVPGTPSTQWPFIHNELPVTDVSLTDVLSGPCRLEGVIDPVYRGLKASDGRLLLDEWSTCIWAESDGQIRGGGIYQGGTFDGPRWQLQVAGYASYPTEMGYEGEYPGGFVQTDPLDIVRHIWAHIQGGLYSDLGLVVDDSTTTPVRIGQPESSDETSSSDGPFELNEWSVDDLGRVIDDLAKSTPFDYHERHYWNQRRNEIHHELRFGFPQLGVRRPNLRFVFGDNIQEVPSATRGSRYANHVRFLGAGEGRDMVRAESRQHDGRLRRMVTVDDKSVTAQERAQTRARRELVARQLRTSITNVVCRNRPDAPLGSWQVGDEVRVQGRLDWLDVDMWCRVLSITITPDNPEIIGMALLRSELQ